MEEIFCDLEIEALEDDPEEPGVFLKARKPLIYSMNDTSGYLLYSMVAERRVLSLPDGLESKYEGKLVSRGENTTEGGKVYFIREGFRQWIISASWIESHGFRWPQDVCLIPPAELESIPIGDPIY
jgi:hypothetical protein